MNIDEFKRRFGMRVQEIRIRKGLTQEKLAERIGRSPDMLSNVERGKSGTGFETLLQIAAALEVSLPDLFDLDQVGPSDRKVRHKVNQLLDLVGPQSEEFLTVVIAQVEIMLRAKGAKPTRK